MLSDNFMNEGKRNEEWRREVEMGPGGYVGNREEKGKERNWALYVLQPGFHTQNEIWEFVENNIIIWYITILY